MRFWNPFVLGAAEWRKEETWFSITMCICMCEALVLDNALFGVWHGECVSPSDSLQCPPSLTHLVTFIASLLACHRLFFSMLLSTHLHLILHNIRIKAARTWGLLGFGRNLSLLPEIGVKFILGCKKPRSGRRNTVSLTSHFKGKWGKPQKRVPC